MKNIMERFFERVNKDGPVPEHRPELGPCWLWTYRKNRNGYGRFYVAGRNPVAHKWLYEQQNGPVPHPLQLDHLCRTKHCVNPSHLEQVTSKENILRGNCPPAVNARKTECPKGHKYTASNTYTAGKSGRICRACSSARDHHRKGARA